MMDIGTVMTVKKGSEGMKSWLAKVKECIKSA